MTSGYDPQLARAGEQPAGAGRDATVPTPAGGAPTVGFSASTPYAGASQPAGPAAAGGPTLGGSDGGWEPSVGYPRPYNPPPAPVAHPQVPSAPKSRSTWPGVVALLLVAALGGVAGFQAYQINRLEDRLAALDRKTGEEQATTRSRLDALDGRAAALEKQTSDIFNPEAIAAAVLPSVFRVSAGEVTGTAFAIGKPAPDGGTNLFTNFHVVESVWKSGGRRVFIERRDQRFPATIVRVDEANDVAHLRTQSRFTGLEPAADPVKSGQQIVVVGAPLGLEDTVTTGVVSAFRKTPDGFGTVIQFDASINPGNSGGPVINRSKQVVGIATAKARNAEGIGLAVPIKTACDEFRIC